MWQQVLIAPIVAASAGYAAWSMLPVAARWRLRRRAASLAGRAPRPLASLAQRALRPATAPTACGCSACPASAPREAASRGR